MPVSINTPLRLPEVNGCLYGAGREFNSVYDLGSAAAPASCQHSLMDKGADLPLFWFLDSSLNLTHRCFWDDSAGVASFGHQWDLSPNTQVSRGSFEILLSLTHWVLIQNKYFYSLNLWLHLELWLISLPQSRPWCLKWSIKTDQLFSPALESWYF